MESLIPWFTLAVLFSLCANEKRRNGLDLMPGMVHTDSVQIIYFKAPQDPRYFTYVQVNDAEFIQALVKDVTVETSSGNTCMKEGKKYCYKNGEIFNTIFFAYLDDKCSILRYIKNGNLYHFPMSAKFKAGLQRYKALATEPTAVE